METATCYICSFCGKIYRREKSCAWHEKYCGKNPVNQFECLNECAHLLVDTDENKHKHFTCLLKNKEMYTHVALRRRLKLDEGLELMPLSCSDFTLPPTGEFATDDIEYTPEIKKLLKEIWNQR